MARAIKEIQDNIIADVNTDVPELTSQSKFAKWYQWTRLVAVAIYAFELILDLFQEDMEVLFSENRMGTLAWYSALSKEFQYSSAETGNYFLITDENGQVRWNVISEEAQIVSQASVKEDVQTHTVSIKVAKGEEGALAELTAEELRQFIAYITEIKPPGIEIAITSDAPDKVRATIQLTVQGVISRTLLEENIIEQLNLFAQNFSFDGILYRNDMEQILRGIEGVRDVSFTLLDIEKSSDQSIINVGDSTEVPAGYFIIDESQLTINFV